MITITAILYALGMLVGIAGASYLPNDSTAQKIAMGAAVALFFIGAILGDGGY